MYQIDVSSVASTRPNSSALGTVGYFTDGNAATGVEATVVPAEFLNSVMLEIMGAITGAGLTLSKSSFTQLYTAIQTIAQGGGTTYAADTGAANAYKATYTPTVSAPADGMVRAFKVKTVNTGASTFALDGSGTTYPIYGLGGTALTGGELAANGIAVLRYNSTLAGWVLFHCSGGAQQLPSGSYVPTPAQFSSGLQVANMAALQRALGNFQSAGVMSAATVLTASQAGSAFSMNTGAAPTLPLFSTVASGAGFKFVNASSAAIAVSTQGSDKIFAPVNGAFTSTATAITVAPGDSVTIVAQGIQWEVFESPILATMPGGRFAASFGSPGYQKLPSGLIIQWGYTALTNGSVSVTYPIAFPNAALSAVAIELAASTWTNSNVSVYGVYGVVAASMSIRIANYNGSSWSVNNAGNAYWIAIGY